MHQFEHMSGGYSGVIVVDPVRTSRYRFEVVAATDGVVLLKVAQLTRFRILFDIRTCYHRAMCSARLLHQGLKSQKSLFMSMQSRSVLTHSWHFDGAFTYLAEDAPGPCISCVYFKEDMTSLYE